MKILFSRTIGSISTKLKTEHYFVIFFKNMLSSNEITRYTINQIRSLIKRQTDLKFDYSRDRCRMLKSTGKNPKIQYKNLLFCQIKFPRKLFLNKINIFETYNAGAMVRIAAKDPQNQWVDVYHARHAHLIRKSRKFSPKIKACYNEIFYLNLFVCLFVCLRERDVYFL